MYKEQLSLFDENEDNNTAHLGNLNVVHLEFLEGHSTSWQELFTGYDELHAITYSSGIGFIAKLINLFENAEIIFGCEQVISYAVNEVMAFQTALIERVRLNKSKDILIDRIQNGTLKLLVTHGKLSHEKIYLLSSKDGKKRVIMGSANMSEQAFSGHQRENISYMDGEEAYEWYMSIYETLREDCTDNITEKAILFSDDCDGLDTLPISQAVKIKKALAIVPDHSADEDIEFALNIKKLSDKMKTIVPKADKKGKILLSPSKVTVMKTQAKEANQAEKEKRQEFPQLVIDIDKGTAFLNDIKLDLTPSKEDIENDIKWFLYYLDGFSAFHGDYRYMQNRYYEFANWFFCSPFMAIMRDVAERNNHPLLPYPAFGLIYGQSKAGKTSFLKTLQKMMIGQSTVLPASEFTRKSIEAFKYNVKGVPIIVDDLTRDRFSQHAVETIKSDAFGIADKNIHYPAVVISANEDVKSVAQEITRRTVICRVNAGLTNTEVMKSTVVKKTQKNIGTAFYREYLHRMTGKVKELSESIKDENEETPPDILKLSAGILLDIFKEYSSDLPEYIRPLSLDNYFSEKVTANSVIKEIQSAWKTSHDCFEIDKKANTLSYNTGQSYEADRIIRQLPENLVPRKVRDCVVMDLAAAKEFFSINFKKSFFDRFKQ